MCASAENETDTLLNIAVGIGLHQKQSQTNLLNTSYKTPQDEPRRLEGEGPQDQLPSDPETIDENLDVLGRLVNMAAAGRNLQFVTSQATFLPRDLHLGDPMNPSGRKQS